MLQVNEIFYTVHGEGIRWGLPFVFVRFAHCNTACDFCDTEFTSFREMTPEQVLAECKSLWPAPAQPVVQTVGVKYPDNGPNPAQPRALFCGGEPFLQLSSELVQAFKDAGWWTQAETNGTLPAPAGLDWITCSPKVAEHALKLEHAHELKYVRAHGQGIPRPKIPADNYLISPLFNGDDLDKKSVKWCVQLVKENPAWRMTIQNHKLLGER